MKKLVAGFVTVAVLALAPAALAKTYRPHKLGDHAPGACTPADCTLREAVIAANAHSGSDTIVLKGGKTYNLTRTTPGADETYGDLDVDDPLAIASSKARKRATIDANRIDGVIESNFGIRLILARIVIRGGQSTLDAGGVEAKGPLRLSHSVVRGNRGDTGGVDLSDASTFSHSVVKGNLGVGSSSDGGIVSSLTSPERFKLIHSKVINNRVDSSSGDVGGIDSSGPLFILRSKVNGNIGGNDNGGGTGGGAMYVGGETTIKRSTVNGNKSVAVGGGLAIYDFTRIIRSTIAGNRSDDAGGGIYVDFGTLTIKQSTISGNRAFGFGGGIDLVIGADVAMSQSTVSGNSAFNGGGIAGHGDPGSSFKATNSTFANNRARATAGGVDIFDNTAATLRSVSIVRNHGHTQGSGLDGAGLFNSASTTLRNSIVALNKSGNARLDCFGNFSSAGRNLFSRLTSDCTGFTRPPNIVQHDPHLGKLAKNGGPTKTVALKKHSKAINRAGAGSPSRDQRGHKRHNPDIGAFER